MGTNKRCFCNFISNSVFYKQIPRNTGTSFHYHAKLILANVIKTTVKAPTLKTNTSEIRK